MNLLLSNEPGVYEGLISSIGIPASIINVHAGDTFSLLATNQLSLDFYGAKSVPIGIPFTANNYKASVSDRSDFEIYFERALIY